MTVATTKLLARTLLIRRSLPLMGFSPLSQAREFPRLFQSFGLYNPGAFLDGQDLIGFDLGEFLDLLRRGPLDFDRIDLFRIPQAEMKP
jgi:hypothetical protein